MARFADDYDVFVDYGKGRPIKINENETTFIDVEKFLMGHKELSSMLTKKNFNRTIGKNSFKERKNDERCRQTTRSVQCTPTKDYSHRISSQISRHWPSHRLDNPRVSAFHHQNQPKILPTALSTRNPRRKLRLNIAVNGVSKSMRDYVPISNFNLTAGDFGDDAGLFTENDQFSIVGLADGASGNRLLGINPADFPRAMLAACEDMFRRNSLPSNRLSRLVLSAIEQVQNKQIRGSSTLCLLSLDKSQQHLNTLNIGDSGFVIYRNHRLFHRSTCTMHSEGYGPKQLFALESSFNLPCFLHEDDIRRDCSFEHIAVEENDLIILASDGLWNVLENRQLQRIITQNRDQDLQHLTDDLLDQAIDGYVTNNRDDILIIVCRVEQS